MALELLPCEGKTPREKRKLANVTRIVYENQEGTHNTKTNACKMSASWPEKAENRVSDLKRKKKKRRREIKQNPKKRGKCQMGRRGVS